MLATMARAILPTWERVTRPGTGAGGIARSQRAILARLMRRLAPLPVGAMTGLRATSSA